MAGLFIVALLEIAEPGGLLLGVLGNGLHFLSVIAIVLASVLFQSDCPSNNVLVAAIPYVLSISIIVDIALSSTVIPGSIIYTVEGVHGLAWMYTGTVALRTPPAESTT
jgi:hypothetical protein